MKMHFALRSKNTGVKDIRKKSYCKTLPSTGGDLIKDSLVTLVWLKNTPVRIYVERQRRNYAKEATF